MSVEIVETGSNQLEVLDFRLKTKSGGEEIYGINVSKVTEIVSSIGRIALVPGAPPSQLGVVSIRGKTIPVFDMGKFLDVGHVQETDPARDPFVITEFSDLSLGFLVHSVNRIRRISWKDIQPVATTNAGPEENRRVVGTVILPESEGSGIMLILDLEAIAHGLGFFGGQERESHEMALAGILEGKKILVVEDSVATRKIIVTTLRKSGATTIEAGNGSDALEIVRRDPDAIDLILSDVEMPSMDGYALTKAVRSIEGAPPVVLHSSMSGKPNIKKGKEAGAIDYLVKLHPGALVGKIAEILSLPSREARVS